MTSVNKTGRLLIADHDANAVIWAKPHLLKEDGDGVASEGGNGGAVIGARAARHEEVVHAAMALNARASRAVHRRSMTLISRFSQVVSIGCHVPALFQASHSSVDECCGSRYILYMVYCGILRV